MTLQELETKTYELKSYIADKFRDIQMQANSLKNVEDEDKVLITLAKLTDFITEIRRGYSNIALLYQEEIEEEIEETDDCDIFSNLGF